MRTAGALLLLAGAVGVIDKFLPGGVNEAWPAWVQPTAAGLLLAVGAVLFVVGKRWS